MARRKIRPPEDSLDLLLDTMCNSFGGIVLIAILVALMVQKPGEDNPTIGNKEDAKLLDHKNKIVAELSSRAATLETELKETGELIDLIKQKESIEALISERKKSGIETLDDLSNKLNKASAQKAAEELRATELKQLIASLLAEEESLARQEMKLDQQTKDLINSRKMEVRPPRVSEFQGAQLSFLIRYNEVFPIQTFSFDSEGSLTNLVNNTTSMRWQGGTPEPIQGRGISLTSGKAELRNIFSGLKRLNQKNARNPSNPQIYVISFVHPDSFDKIEEYREMIKNIGEVRDGWEPLHEGQALVFGEGGSSVNPD